jgi:hypothetical protein
MQTKAMTCCNIYQDLLMDLGDKDLLKSSDDEEGIVFNETE